MTYHIARHQQVVMDRARWMKRAKKSWAWLGEWLFALAAGCADAAVFVIGCGFVIAIVGGFIWLAGIAFCGNADEVYPDPVCELCGEVMDENYVPCRMFHGTGEELVAKAYKDSESSGREYQRVVDYVASILKDEAEAAAKKAAE